jgi:hypothetical protein
VTQQGAAVASIKEEAKKFGLRDEEEMMWNKRLTHKQLPTTGKSKISEQKKKTTLRMQTLKRDVKLKEKWQLCKQKYIRNQEEKRLAQTTGRTRAEQKMSDSH